MAEITEQGIQGRSLNEYLSDIQTRMLNIDPAWNIDADSPDGQKNGIDAELLTNLDEAVVEAYNSKDPDRATGEALNDIGKISGVLRQEATQSIAPIQLSGAAGTIIPPSSQIRSRVDNSLWLTNSQISIDSGGTGSGFAVSSVAGAVNAGAGELTVIGTPVAGWSSVTNTGAATIGRDAESDVNFRIRRAASVSLPGSNQLDNMYAAVANVENVSDVKVYENSNISPTDSNGLPVHSISIVVNGGSDAEVAYAIYTKKNPGVALYPRYNDETDTFIDVLPNGVEADVTSQVTGNVAAITFQRALALPIFVEVDIVQIGTLPSNIITLIKQAIEDDAEKTLFGDDSAVGFNQRGYDIGEVVPVGRLYTPVNKVLGFYGDSYVSRIEIGTTAGSLSATTIQPAYNQLPTFDDDNITVDIT